MIYLLLGYVLLLLLVGVSHIRKIKSIDDFYVAGRSRNTLELVGTLFSTIIGASAIIGVSGLAYLNGFSALWWLWSGAFFLLILAFFLLRSVMEFKVYTLPQLLGSIYGREMQLLASLVIVVSWVGVVAGQIVGMYQIVRVLTDMSSSMVIVGLGLVVVLYTGLAGQYSVIKTDIIQAVLFAIAIVIVLFAMEKNVIIEISSKNVRTLSKNILYYLTFVGLSFIVGPDIYSRIFSAKSYRAAKSALIISALLILVFSIFIVIIGMYGTRFTTISSDAFFATIEGLQISRFFFLLVLLGLFSALLSSADTVLLTSSIILINDVLKLKRRQIFYTRIAIVVFGLLSIALAIRFKEIIALLLYAYSIFISSIVLPALFGLVGLMRGVNKKWLLIVIGISAVAALVNKIFNMFSPYYPLLFNLSALLLMIVFKRNEEANC